MDRLIAAILTLPLTMSLAADAFAQRPADTLPELSRQGEGPTALLILPCMSCRWKSWDTFMARNKDRYTMYAVTPAGYGGTPVPDLPRNTTGTPWRDHLLGGLVDLVERDNLREVVVVGHSWGSMVAVQLAARLPDRISGVISLDGSIVSEWVPDSDADRLQSASDVVTRQSALLADAEYWRTFNGGRDTLAPPDTPSRLPRHRSLLYHGMFMATDRGALIQYWRENLLIDLTSVLRTLTIPILDIQVFGGGNFEEQKRQHLELLASEGAPDNVTPIFIGETSHFAHEHRPQLIDQIIADFIAGRPVGDYRPGGMN